MSQKFRVGSVVEVIGKIARLFNVKPPIGVIGDVERDSCYPYTVMVLTEVDEDIVIERLPVKEEEMELTNLTLPPQLQEYRNDLLKL